MFWRKFNGRELPSRYNSSRVLELKKVPVKKKKKYDENSGGTYIVTIPFNIIN